MDEVKILKISDFIIAPDESQLRATMSEQVIKDYMRAYENSAHIPSVLIAVIRTAQYLVSGFHRVEALKRLNFRTVEARTVRAKNKQEALWLGAVENLTHGLRYKDKEKDTVLAAYIEAGQWKTDYGKPAKSYEEIAQDLGGLFSKATLWRRMKKNHPDIHYKIRNSNYKGGGYMGQGDFNLKEHLANQPTKEEKAAYVRILQTRRLLDNLKHGYIEYTTLNKQQRETIKRTLMEIIKGCNEYDKGLSCVLPDIKGFEITHQEESIMRDFICRVDEEEW